jgi:hypothetical protein
MDKRTTSIIATVVAALFCGCPGLFSVCWGAMFAVISQIPGAEIDVMGSSDPSQALFTGIGALCGGLLLVLIPIAVGFFTLRKKEDAPASLNNL